MSNKDVTINILSEASRLLNGNGWIKYNMARDAHGNVCVPTRSEASCFCLSGALVRAWRTIDPAQEEFYYKYFEAKFAEVLEQKYNYIYPYTRWNDQVAKCKEDVIGLIDSVVTNIAESEKEAAATERERTPSSRIGGTANATARISTARFPVQGRLYSGRTGAPVRSRTDPFGRASR